MTFISNEPLNETSGCFPETNSRVSFLVSKRLLRIPGLPELEKSRGHKAIGEFGSETIG